MVRFLADMRPVVNESCSLGVCHNLRRRIGAQLMDGTLRAYADLCDLDLLRAAYADAVERFPAIRRAHASLHSSDKDRLIEELARDLELRTYQPLPANSSEPGGWDQAAVRDRVVQSAMRIVCGSRFGPVKTETIQAEEAVRWMARAMECGLTRVFVVRLEVEANSLGGWKPDATSTPEHGNAWFSLLRGMLATYPSLWREDAFAPYLCDSIFCDIDRMLEQVNVIGKRDSYAPVKCARFRDYLIVLVDPAPQNDWVIPGVQHRLRAELAKIKGDVDPGQTQLVNLGPGDKLRFWGYELRVSGGHAKQIQVAYDRLKGKKPSAPSSAAPSSKEAEEPVPARRKKETIAEEEPVGRASLIPWPAFPVLAFQSIWQHLPALNGQVIGWSSKEFMRWLRRHWTSSVAGFGMIVLVFLVSAYVRSTSHSGRQAFHRDFRRDAAGPPLLPFGPVKVQFQSRDEGGVLITLPNTRAETKPVGVRTKFGAQGNFEITATYEVLRLERPDSGWGTGVFLALANGSPAGDVARIGRVLDPNNKPVFKWDRVDQKSPGAASREGGQVPGKGSAGRLQLVRNGSKLSFFVADGPDADFVLVHEEEFGKQDIESIHFAATTDDQPAAVAVRLVDFDVKADRLATGDTAGSTWNPYLVSMASVGAAVVGILMYGYGSRRRSSGPIR